MKSYKDLIPSFVTKSLDHLEHEGSQKNQWMPDWAFRYERQLRATDIGRPWWYKENKKNRIITKLTSKSWNRNDVEEN